MSYTLEQKRDAVKRKELWWMCLDTDDEYLRKWTSVHQDMGGVNFHDCYLLQDGTEYFIGAAAPAAPAPPRVLSELEGELLEALKEVIAVFDSNPSSIVDTVWVTGNRPETLYDLCLAAIQKAESTP